MEKKPRSVVISRHTGIKRKFMNKCDRLRAFSFKVVPLVAQLFLSLLCMAFYANQEAYAGTRFVPFSYPTIQSAIDASRVGDIVEVAGGYYLESITLKRGVAVRGAGAERTFLSFPARTVTGANGASLSGFTISSVSGDAAVYCLNVSPVIRDNVIQGSKVGVYVHSYGDGAIANPLIENNIIQKNSGTGVWVSASQTYVGSNGITSPVIRNNVITLNSDGIFVTANNGGTVVKPKIINNTIVDNSRDGVHFGLAYGQLIPQILNNIVIGSGRCGLRLDDINHAAVPVLGFNNVWNNTRRGYCNVATGINDISADPLFIQPKINYHLSPLSPSIDAGSPSGSYYDVNLPPSLGTQRNDQGAFGGPYTRLSFFSFPLICSTTNCFNGIYYLSGAYTENSINSVLDHMSDHPYIPLDGKVLAFTGELADGATKLGDATCVKSSITGYLFSVEGLYSDGGCNSKKYLSYDNHPGYDYKATCRSDNSGKCLSGTGAAVNAAAGGKVVRFGREKCIPLGIRSSGGCSAWGAIGIDHGNGYISQYFHLSKILVESGDVVAEGQLIGYSGNTSPPVMPVGPHLHFEVLRRAEGSGGASLDDYKIVDPYGWRTGRYYDPSDSLADPLETVTGVFNVRLWNLQSQ